MVLTFWDAIERAKIGPRMEESDFNMKIWRTVEALSKEYNFEYDPKIIVPVDNQLADEVWEAGLRAAVELGVYCTDTGRNIRFSEDEIEEFLKAATGKALGLGEGKDAVELSHRGFGDITEPVVCAGIQTALYSSEQTAFKMYRLCAREPSTDGIWQGLVTKIGEKHEIRAKHPSEVYQYRREVEIMRRAIASAGRPGVFIYANAPSAVATIGMADPLVGIRQTDPLGMGVFGELKINYDYTSRTGFAIAYGTKFRSGSGHAYVGGFSGGPRTAPIVMVASALLGLFFSGADDKHIVNYGVGTSCISTDIGINSRACRSIIYTGSLALQAIVRNCRIPCCGSGCDHPVAGPGTEQYLYEAAAGNIAHVASGASGILGGTRKFVIGNTLNFGTPIESKWMGEVVKSSAGLNRKKAGEIVEALLPKYEERLKEGYPEGYTFEQLYDVDREMPKPEYKMLYERVKAELEDLGLKFKRCYC